MVTAITEWTEPDRIEAITASAERLLRKMAPNPGEACVWCLLEVVWPGLPRKVIEPAWLNEVRVQLVPLSRIGQMEGRSGSLVLIGRLGSPGANRPSNPLVVKTRDKSKSGGSLAIEWQRALAAKPHTYDRKDSFAIPVHFDDEDGRYEVLWTLCLPSVRESEGDKIDYERFQAVDDLRKLLAFAPRQALSESPETDGEAGRILESTYALLRNLHRTSAVAGSHALAREVRPLGEEYAWYLRQYTFEAGGLWGREWAEVWAPPTQQAVRDGINPLWLVERLRGESVQIQLGLVHGDLHAGNIVLRGGDAPAIIDFGWSAERAHVAKDFVLMECNLRFLTLRPQVSDEQLAAFASTLAWDSEPSCALTEYLARRRNLVKVVRDAAKKVFAEDTDWTREYLAPLFLVAFGLLRFAPQLGNQRAAMGMVEQLATLLASCLNLGETASLPESS